MPRNELIAARKKERDLFQELLERNNSEFVAVFGRRRVGKTFLIREYFKDKFTFTLTGLANVGTTKQLLNFDLTLKHYHEYNQPITNWIEAFHALTRYLESIKTKEKKVIFLDELPWFDTKGSDFISGLEHFWNSWASARKDILLITCGSAASWMINNLIHNRGGLHNRVTQRMKIEPLTLIETEEMLKLKGCNFGRFQIAQLYMVMGGVPFYLNGIQKGKSVQQNIQDLFFEPNGLLHDEFQNLYRSLFRKHEIHEKIVETLSTKSAGFTRQEIIAKSKFKSGGTLTKILHELEQSGFISAYFSIENKKKNTLYRLSDFYTYFYFRFLVKKTGKGIKNWADFIENPAYRAWSGFAFEQLCINHIKPIKEKLGIAGIRSTQTTWTGTSDGEKSQIDFIIDRRDDVTNLCECKFSISEFTIDKEYNKNLARKIDVFRRVTGTQKALFLTMITTHGVKKNEHYYDYVANEIVLDDLFKTSEY
jgi:AAA+ ATPase superfamily predicted ATPase